MADKEKEFHISDEQVLARLAHGDKFYSHTCYECGHKAALFVLRSKYVGVCPKCVQERIDALERELGGLPKDIEYFRGETTGYAEYQEEKENQPLTVDWDFGNLCHNCGRFTLKEDLRYPQLNPGDMVRYPHCGTCYAIVSGEKWSEGVSQWEGGSNWEEGDTE